MTEKKDDSDDVFNSPWQTSSSFIRRVSRAFDSAEELQGEERDEYLEKLHHQDPKVAQRLEKILDTNVDVDGFFETLLSTAPPVDGAGELLGQTVGGYRTLEQIGEGGMGIVYRARNENEALDQQVAIKVLRQRWLSSGVEIRFAREAQILVTLDHPNIARIHNVGTHNDFPYLIMEFVDGERLDTYCAHHKLGIEQRLQLFANAVDAVAHAQSKAIIHRDLKPRNILVTREGQVKLLDFGIAKILSSDTPDPSDLTQLLGQLVSPEVAAPEQWRNEAQTMATDVYALGVVLFKLLCGDFPFHRDEIYSARQDGAWPRPLPSMTDVLDNTAEASMVADARGISERELHQTLSGDLQAIVSKATSVEPQNRYAFAAQLHDDIQRYLEGRPVGAARRRPLDTAFKWIARHRIRSGLFASLVLALSMMLVQTVLDAREDRRYVAEIRAERDKAQAVATLFRDSLGVADPDVEGAHSVTVREALLSTGANVLNDEKTSPAIRMELALALGQTLNKLGSYVDAMPLFVEALRLANESTDPSAGQAKAQAMLGITKSAVETEDFATANAKYERTLAALIEHVEQPSASMLDLLNTRSRLYKQWDDPERSVEVSREAHAYAMAHPELPTHLRAIALNDLALSYRDTEPLATVTAMLEEAGDIARSGLPETHPLVSSITSNLATAYLTGGDVEAAEAAYMLVVKTIGMQGVRPNRHTAQAAYGLGATRLRQGRFEEALKLISDAIDLYEQINGPTGFLTLRARYARATTWLLLGNDRDASQEFLSVYDSLMTHHPNTYLVHGVLLRLAALDIDHEDFDGARQRLDRAEQAMSRATRVTQTERDFLRVMRWLCAPSSQTPEWLRQTASDIEKNAGIHGLPNVKVTAWLSDLDVL